MKIFLLIFLVLYGDMHVLVFWGFYPLLKGRPALPTLTWIWMTGGDCYPAAGCKRHPKPAVICRIVNLT